MAKLTDEECLALLRREITYFENERKELNRREHASIESILKKWANDNSPFAIGDIIEADRTIIRIDRILGRKSLYTGKLYCVYFGFVLTKQLNKRKDESRTSIYGDGREIKLIKAKENKVRNNLKLQLLHHQ